MKTLPFAECTVSDYTFLSQACSEQRKAHTSIDSICPTLFLCRYSKQKKVVSRNTIRRQQGLGIFSDPEGGTSSIEKRQRSIQMKGTSTAELQMELQKVRMLCKKKVLQETLLCVHWQRYAKRFQKDVQNIGIRSEFFFFRCLFREKGVTGRNHPSTLKLER